MLIIKNSWYMAAWSNEVGNAPFARTICGEAVVLYRELNGNKVACLEDRCKHRGAPLRFGEVTEAGLQCGYHGVVYDCKGTCVKVPGQEGIPDTLKVQSFVIHEQDEIIWIWAGDPALADVSKIISYPYHNDHKSWPHRTQAYHAKADALLVIENLMDLTHLAYVHKSTIGGNAKAHVEAKMRVTRKPTGLHFVRWLLDSVPPATHVKAVGLTGNVDRWMDFEFIAPGVVIQWTGALPVGMNAEENRMQDGGFSLRILHCITPERDGTCWYFWSASNGYRQDDPQATDILFEQIDTAFMEDKRILEAQQETLAKTGDTDLVDIASDSARIYMRRTLTKLSAESWKNSN